MTKHNYDLTLLCLLLGLMPACKLGDQNLGETGESGTDNDDDLDDDDSNGDHEEFPDGTGDHDPIDDEDTGDETCEAELCFEATALEVPGPVLSIAFDDVDGGGESGVDDLVATTSNLAAPLVIWHFDPDTDQIDDEPEIVEGPLPTPAIPGLVIGDFDPLGIEYQDIAYASTDGVVIAWDKLNVGFDDVTLALACPNPTSFAFGHFDVGGGGADLVCARLTDGGSTEVLFASNLDDRSFSAPITIASELPAITPLRQAIDYSGPVPLIRFVAHDRVDQLLVWRFINGEVQQSSNSAPGVAWDLGLPYLADGTELVVASHDPPALLMMTGAPGGGFELDGVLATPGAALPYRIASANLDQQSGRELITTLDSGHLAIWPGIDTATSEPVLIEVGPEPREIAMRGLSEGVLIAVTHANGSLSLLYPKP